MIHSCNPLLIQSLLAGWGTLMMYHMPFKHTMPTEMSWWFRMVSSLIAKPSLFCHPERRRGSRQSMKDTRVQPKANTIHNTIYTALASVQISTAVACLICQSYHPKEPQQLLQPTPGLHHSWQTHGADYFHFDGSKYLVIDYYSKVLTACRILASQCSAEKTISVMMQLFAEHGTPETFNSNNGPQFAEAFFAELAKEWKFWPQHQCTYELPKKWPNRRCCEDHQQTPYPCRVLMTWPMSSPPGIQQHTHWCTPVLFFRNAVPVSTMYNCATTYMAHKTHATTNCNCHNQHVSLRATYHNYHGWRKKSQLFTGQSVSVLNDAKNLWLPGTIIYDVACNDIEYKKPNGTFKSTLISTSNTVKIY